MQRPAITCTDLKLRIPMSISVEAEQSPPPMLTLNKCSGMDVVSVLLHVQCAKRRGSVVSPSRQIQGVGEISSDFWKFGAHIVRHEEVIQPLSKLHHF